VRLLVDECCDRRLVAALREAGHDVRYGLEIDPGASDEGRPRALERDRGEAPGGTWADAPLETGSLR
jgi:hypothetical protein